MAQSREDRAGRGARRSVGQQSGSKRPAERIGAEKLAPKKRTVEPKGTARAGAGKKIRPGKGGAMKRASPMKPSARRRRTGR
jgi:hypothetical protein